MTTAYFIIHSDELFETQSFLLWIPMNCAYPEHYPEYEEGIQTYSGVLRHTLL